MARSPITESLEDPGLAWRIERLQLAYVHSIDDGELDEWPDFFVDPCLYRVTGRDNYEAGRDIGLMRFESVGMLRDRVVATHHAAVFAPRTIRHILGGTMLEEIGRSGVRTRTNVSIFQTSAEGDTTILMVGQYHDWIVDEDGSLLFREKQLVYDTLRVPDSIVFPL